MSDILKYINTMHDDALIADEHHDNLHYLASKSITERDAYKAAYELAVGDIKKMPRKSKNMFCVRRLR